MRVEEWEGGAVFQEGEDSVSNFVQGEVLADIPLGGFPHEGALCRVKLGKEGAVALGGPKCGLIGDGFVQAVRGRVDFGWGGGHSQGGHALIVFDQQGEGREVGFDGLNRDRGGREAVGDPSVDVSPERV